MINRIKIAFTANPLITVLGILLLIRLLSLAIYPLMDTTEARYGEMARLMAETGNWLTPLFNYDVPFWGKPPLHTWMSAAGIEVFGVTEFAVRFPHWCAAVFVIALTAYLAKTLRLSVVKVAIVLTSTVVFYVSAGAVMTDMALTVGMTLAMVGFYLCWQGSKKWGYLGFAGLAIGLLAKGPVILVLMGLSVGLWLIWGFGLIKPWKELVKRVPLVSGLLLMLLLSLPWYLMAEQATPGFLEYFILGEHWLRFVDSGWQGDLYGSAHDEPRGTIWLFFAVAALPWTLFIPRALWRLWRKGIGFDLQTKFFLCWMVSPMILFTFAGNVLPAYVLPGVPAVALLLVYAWKGESIPLFKTLALTISMLLLLTAIVLGLGPSKDKSDRWLLEQRTQTIPTYYWDKLDFSSRFYSQGKAQLLQNKDEYRQSMTSPHYLVIEIKQLRLTNDFSMCQLQAERKRKALLLCGRS
ncbi:glycosyltransferase family 39 protein [Shewanella eurypsychrophilus]|uniref:Glycosyltransferase family 39 protein n=1 Tax=Shewanella eurypsychrophilus TaxID=2593656 RepID=A0ABX6VB04_9GAMM|nr:MULTISPECIES: glycosyltransferase family 39 protein [Shewanella]QFU24505.1 phospholipid carrier-dependent glycosyltransferase [Shewanella sp. YLB-09]QPG59703.1 glycosyltransferase family 39 protein [Shewanella eurypsychrophilus]